MLSVARERLRGAGAGARIEFRAIDALEALSRPEARESFDCVFSSWVLGYIPLRPFFEAAERALRPGGALAFVVHRLDSPREPLELFGALAAEEPEMLEKQTAFDFPKDLAHARLELERAGLRLEWGAEDSIVFRCESARGALDHLLKSGAGTAYYDAVRAERRAALEEEFVARLQALHPDGPVEVRHDYVCAVARKGIAPGM